MTLRTGFHCTKSLLRLVWGPVSESQKAEITCLWLKEPLFQKPGTKQEEGLSVPQAPGGREGGTSASVTALRGD